VLLASSHSFADNRQGLIDLLRGKHKGDDTVFPERGNVLKGVFPHTLPAQKEVEEDPDRGEHPVDTAWLHLEIGSHLKEVEGLKGLPICVCLSEVSIKDKKMGS
jgi:hypothetical protein